jgi:hypothetical protein
MLLLLQLSVQGLRAVVWVLGEALESEVEASGMLVLSAECVVIMCRRRCDSWARGRR